MPSGCFHIVTRHATCLTYRHITSRTVSMIPISGRNGYKAAGPTGGRSYLFLKRSACILISSASSK